MRELHISWAGSLKQQGSRQTCEVQMIGTHLEKKESNHVEKEADLDWIIPYHLRHDVTGMNRVCCDVWMHINTQRQYRDSGYIGVIGYIKLPSSFVIFGAVSVQCTKFAIYFDWIRVKLKWDRRDKEHKEKLSQKRKRKTFIQTMKVTQLYNLFLDSVGKIKENLYKRGRLNYAALPGVSERACAESAVVQTTHLFLSACAPTRWYRWGCAAWSGCRLDPSRTWDSPRGNGRSPRHPSCGWRNWGWRCALGPTA